MNRDHIPSYQLHMGQQVYVVPRDNSTPRGPKHDPIPLSGMVVRVDDYIYGCIQRGAMIAYSLECRPAEAPATAPAAPVAKLAAGAPAPTPVAPPAEASAPAAPAAEAAPASAEAAPVPAPAAAPMPQEVTP